MEYEQRFFYERTAMTYLLECVYCVSKVDCKACKHACTDVGPILGHNSAHMMNLSSVIRESTE